MPPASFTVKRGYGKPRPALHPDKRNSLRTILIEKKKRKSQKEKAKERPAPTVNTSRLPSGDKSALVDAMAYRLHDPGFRTYLKRKAGLG